MKPTTQLIQTALIAALNPETITVTDDHEEHVGHAHADSGHFTVHITAKAFQGKNAVTRHRLIYQSLGSLMQTHIHALRIDAKAPGE